METAPDRQFFAISFKNNSDGYVLRSSISKKCSCSDITTLDPAGKMTDKVTGNKVLVCSAHLSMRVTMTLMKN